ncbi:MAG TPA: phosphate ABC transporter permease subunit PstC [Nitrososphaerales archaeon]|nr:phosphate ABC transporter permease subunit PstC [Nitrososphaerales archaeon]
MNSSNKIGRRRVGGDQVLKGLVAAAAVSIVLLLIALGVELINGSYQSLTTFGFPFLYSTTWDPNHNIFGALPFIYGTLVTSAIALLIGLPVSLGVAIFLSEKAKGHRFVGYVLGSLVELLAAVPSVIFGLWGLFVLSPNLKTYVEGPIHDYLGFLPIFSTTPIGLDYFVTGIILAIMIIPTVAAVSRDVLNAVPNSQREAMYSLGATHWEVIRKSVLPYARSGIFGATILGLGRAVGETMAVTFVIGNSTAISPSLFAQGYTLSALIVNQVAETSTPLNASAIVEIALILFGLALVINIFARLFVVRLTRGTRFRA